MFALSQQEVRIRKRRKVTQMNQDQLLGIVRHVLTTVAGMAVAKGYLDDSSATAIVGGVIALLGVVWSYKSKKA